MIDCCAVLKVHSGYMHANEIDDRASTLTSDSLDV